MNNKRKLNVFYAIETLNAKLNGSSDTVEKARTGFKNVGYVKKIGTRSKISSACQKYALREFMREELGAIESEKVKEGKQIKGTYDPYNSEIDDLFGFMKAESVDISKEEYDGLDEKFKGMYAKNGKKYKADITVKRKSRVQMNALINTSNNKINWEYCVASSTTNSMPFVTEVYSGIHTSILNINIGEIGKFNISNVAAEFRDYNELDAEKIGVRDLTEEERFNRVSNLLSAIEYLSISSCQTNYLTDTKPKFIILADYSWGNNAFQGIMKEDGLDIEMLKECIDQNEKYRLSNIYIGVNKFFDNTYSELKEILEKEFEDCNYIKVSNVKNAFEGYKKELKENIVDVR